MITVDDLLFRYASDKAVFDQWATIWDECYRFCMPGRQQFFNATEAQKRTGEIYDETAVIAVQEFASKIGSTMMPPFSNWNDLKAGPDFVGAQVGLVNKSLEPVANYIFEAISNSNFVAASHEALIDAAVGTGALIIEDGTASSAHIRCAAVPLTDMTLGRGPYGEIDAFYRRRKIKGRNIQADYPDAVLPDGLARNAKASPDADFEFIEATIRDRTKPNEEVYDWCVTYQPGKQILQTKTFTGQGSNPWIVFRWAVGSGETYGRGPLLNAMAAVKTCNLTVELILSNAELAIAGVYQYDHDGVMNPDTVQMQPGTFIPRAPNSKGLEPVKSGADFTVADMILKDQRGNIKRALYVQEFAPLDKTPLSATEVVMRQQDLAQRIGSSYGRLQIELVNAVIIRVAFLLKRQKRIKLPLIDGKQVKIDPLSPLAKAQNQDDINSIERFVGSLGQLYGPQMVSIVTKPEETAAELARLHKVKPSLVRTPDEMRAFQKQMATAANAAAQQQQQMQQPGGGGQPMQVANAA